MPKISSTTAVQISNMKDILNTKILNLKMALNTKKFLQPKKILKIWKTKNSFPRNESIFCFVFPASASGCRTLTCANSWKLATHPNKIFSRFSITFCTDMTQNNNWKYRYTLQTFSSEKQNATIHRNLIPQRNTFCIWIRKWKVQNNPTLPVCSTFPDKYRKLGEPEILPWGPQ